MRDAVFTPNYFLSCESSRRLIYKHFDYYLYSTGVKRGIRNEREELKTICLQDTGSSENPRYPLLIKSTILQMGSSYTITIIYELFIIEDLNQLLGQLTVPLALNTLIITDFQLTFIFMGCVLLTRIATIKLLRDEEVSK